MSERTCPWCAEQIPEEAIKCRYCGSRVRGGIRDPREWHRGYPERKIAGVCAAVAHNLSVSVTAIRAGFVFLSFIHGFGIALYLLLWFLLPSRPDELSGLDRTVEAGHTLLGRDPEQGLRRPGAGGPPAGGTKESGGSETSSGWSPTRS